MVSRGVSWWLGGNSGGRRGGREPPRHQAANPAYAAYVRSEAAKKRAALKWVNREMSPPPSLRDYAPAWWIAGREERRRARAANGGEGSSRGPAPPRARRAAPAPPRAPAPPVVAAADYAADSDEERAAIDMMVAEFELALQAEQELERAEQRRAIALVRAREARDRAAGASSSTGPVVKAERGDE